MKNLYIHIGYGKTATSWLQQELFPSIQDIHYLGKTAKIPNELILNWSYWDNRIFAKHREDLIQQLQSQLHPGKNNVISSESFTRAGDELLNQAERIKSVAPDAKIIIVLRDPIDLICSFYKYNVMHDNFFLPLEECLDWGRRPLVSYKRRPIYLPDFFYSEVIELYNKLFSTRNILILRYEELKKSPANFLNKLGLFIGSDLNQVATRNIPRKKINVSPDAKAIEHKRAENFIRFVRASSEEINVATECTLVNDQDERPNEIVSPELRRKLEIYFAGNCYSYY